MLAGERGRCVHSSWLFLFLLLGRCLQTSGLPILLYPRYLFHAHRFLSQVHPSSTSKRPILIRTWSLTCVLRTPSVPAGRALQLPVFALPCTECPFSVLRSQLPRCCRSSVANIGDTVECAQCSMNRDPVAKTRTRPRHEHPRWPKRSVRAGVSVTKC